MGNGITKLSLCFSSGDRATAASSSSPAAVTSEPLDEGLGHSFCYLSSPKFFSISGASVSANPSTALSTAVPSSDDGPLSASAFDSSTSFSSYPLHPIPLSSGFLSGPLDPRSTSTLFSGPLTTTKENHPHHLLNRSLSQGGKLIRSLSKKIARSISVPVKISKDSSSTSSVEIDTAADDAATTRLQWAQGKAGEDRIHVVVSEDHGYIFVGIYDGFNGPDATDYLLSNLYSAVQREVKGLIWEEKYDDDEEREDRKWNEKASSEFKDHGEVLRAMRLALRRTEEEYFDMAENVGLENPELALMGSCVLAVLLKGEDVYVMNVGDSRAVLAQRQQLERISENEGEVRDSLATALAALQLTLDHSTSVEEVMSVIVNWFVIVCL